MQFFNSGLFWLIEGVLLCLVILGMKVWSEDAGISMRPWKWALFGAWLLLLSFSIGFIGTNLGENEVNAAIKGGALFSIITIIAGAGLWKLLRTRTEIKD
jgi:hypothetical protein